MEKNVKYQILFEEQLKALKYYHTFEETRGCKRILDLGCSRGGIFEVFLKRGQEIYGVEKEKEAVKNGKERGYFIIEGDLEEEKTLKEIENLGKFDALLCLDLLEHLKNPWDFLKNIKEFLNESGFVFATIPNIAHWKIRFKLLFGNFNYEREGILDINHLRFFSYKTILKLFEENGYKIEKIYPTSASLPFFPKKWEWKAIQISRIFPNLFGEVFGVKAFPLKNN